MDSHNDIEILTKCNDNITQRRPVIKSKSLERIDMSISLNSSYSDEVVGRSLDISTDVLALYRNEMKEEINALKSNLMSTHNELENVILENNDLKKQIAQLNQEISILKQIYKSPLTSFRKNQSSTRKMSAKRRLTDFFTSTNISPQIQNLITNTVDQEEQPAPAIVDSSQQEIAPRTTENIKTSTQDGLTYDKKAFIFGGQQCRGITKHLIKSRLRSQYLKYQFISFVKPYASTEEILATAKLFDITHEDRVILFIGQNDANPFQIKAELCAFLKSIKCQVIIINVLNNKYLNESKLNEMLNYISKQFSACTYINIDYEISFDYWYTVCNKINTALDQLDYDQKYLVPKSSVCRMDTNLLGFRSKKYDSDIQYNKTMAFTHDKYTQTEIDLNVIDPDKIDLNKTDQLFRN